MEEAKEAIRNQVKKTQTPTMKWVFFLFRRITELVIEMEGKKIKKVLNLGEETIKVLKLMGENYEKYHVRKNTAESGLEPMYVNKTASGGRPEADVIVMFKMLVLQQWHSLSDPELEKQCIDVSFSGIFSVFLNNQTVTLSGYSGRELSIIGRKRKSGKSYKNVCL